MRSIALTLSFVLLVSCGKGSGDEAASSGAGAASGAAGASGSAASAGGAIGGAGSSGAAGASGSSSGLSRVHVDGAALRDDAGRQMLFRGYNVKVAPIFDVTFDDGRTANETFPPFDDAKAQIFEDLGLDVMRVTVNWSGLEPQPGQYSEAFFSRLDQLLDQARQHHFRVFLDMHQDAYSKEIGEDGEPLWAIVPPPTMLLSGPSDDSRRTTAQVIVAGDSFFENMPATDGRPLQQAFATAVEQMVTRYAGDPIVLGYEAFNEPIPEKPSQLRPFYEMLSDGVHAIDPDVPLLFEPLGNRNQSDTATIPSTPWSHGPGIYAVHIYTSWFTMPDQMGWASQDPSVLLPSMSHAMMEAVGWGTPIFVTEFDCDQSIDRGPKWLSAELDLQDQFLASSTVWAWEPGDWGIFDSNDVLRPMTSYVVSRMHPHAVAGNLLQIERPSAGDMIVHYQSTPQTAGLSHEIQVSKYFVSDPMFLCDGVPVTATIDGPRAQITCPVMSGEQTFEVVGTPTMPGPM